MKILFEYKKTNLLLVYGDNGVLEYVLDIAKNRKLMVEYTQVGTGYEFSANNGYVPMSMCNAVYVRIMDLDLFVPKFIFIPNKTEENGSNVL
jgi:hypothetical protein